MKAFYRNGKIVIQKYFEANEIEQLISGISKDLDKIKHVCEDRNAEHFPISSVSSLVERIEKLKTMGKETPIYHEYFDYVTQNKEILSFFKRKIEESEKNTEVYLKKKQLFSDFADNLEKVFNL